MAPLRIDFDNSNDDEARQCIPVYLRIKPTQEEEMSIKVVSDTTVTTNHGKQLLQASFPNIVWLRRWEIPSQLPISPLMYLFSI